MMRMKLIYRFLLMTALLLPLGVGSALAATYNLSAESTTIDYPGVGPVDMWGFALVSYDIGGGLVTVNGPATVPGPALTVPNGDTTLIVNLINNLAEPVSLILPGQALPLVDGLASVPATMTDGQSRTRVTSFVTPTAAGGGSATYTFSGLRPGTYLYESGSHIGVQVPMGLYGAVAVSDDATPPYVTGANEVTLLFSEIDLAMHAEVAGGDYGIFDELNPSSTPYTTALKEGYHPELLLLNGMPFSSDTATALNPAPIAAGDQVLVRLLNAGIRTRSPSFLNVPRMAGTPLPGTELQLVAYDGNLLPTAHRQSGAELPPGSTRDLLLQIDPAASDRYIPVYDRMLGLADGGMTGYLEVGTPAATLTVDTPTDGTVASAGIPGGINCDPGATDCSETVLTGTAMTLHAEPAAADAAFVGWSVATDPAGLVTTGECPDLNDCVVTLDVDKYVFATFNTYTAVTLLAPNTGETISPDSAYTIRWGAPATATTFSLGYSIGTGYPFRAIATNITGSSYRWVIPADALQTNTLIVMVIGYDSTGAEIGRDTSDTTFSIVDNLTLLQPNGGEVIEDVTTNPLSTTDPYTISWSDRLLAGTTVARTALWLQTTPGGSWSPIVSLNGNPGSYGTWDVPATVSSTARVAVIFYDAAGKPILSDTSDAVFGLNTTPAPAAASMGSSLSVAPLSTMTLPQETAVIADPLVLLSPNGGEFIPAGTPFTVIWQSNLEASQYGIQVSIDNGETWTSIGADIPDTQFDWLPAAKLAGSSRVLLKVTAYGGDGKPIAEDVSNEPFALE